MRSYPSPGDGLGRKLQKLVDELNRLKSRSSSMSKKIAELEARIAVLEEEP